MILYSNDFFSIVERNDDVFIKVSRAGFDMRSFNEILQGNPRIMLTNFLNLKKALEDANNVEIKIGKLRSEVEVILSKDEITCKVKVNYPKEYIAKNNLDVITSILNALEKEGVREGIISDAINAYIPSNEEFLVAKGILPIDGEDSKIRYFDLSDRRPQIEKDGRANYYELNLIDVVRRGDWLGEKIPFTGGKNGITVTGKILPAKKGRDRALMYDRKTVREYKQGEKFVLKALTDGAVAFRNGKICVENHLVINGDVDYSVGNIDFDGFVTVRGTIKDGFSVVAKYDISILSPMGIGATGKIHSMEGSIFIKGGVNGKFISEIEAKKDVYVKYCNETTITAENKIDIGYYSIDCNLKAEKILMNKQIGRLIGGNVHAGSQIITGTIGNKYERRTNVNVDGFDRISVKKEFEEVLRKYKELLTFVEDLKAELDIYDLNFSINYDDGLLKDYNEQVKKYEDLIEKVTQLDEKRIQLQEVLKSKGEGQVSISSGAYPKTFLELKRVRKKIDTLIKGTFYINGRELFFEED